MLTRDNRAPGLSSVWLSRETIPAMAVKGVLPLYRKFKEHLRNEPHTKLARMQLLCRLEDYLTKEFASVILDKSDGEVLPILNTGKKTDGRGIDIALAEGDLSKVEDKNSADEFRPTIRNFIEVKYIRNRH